MTRGPNFLNLGKGSLIEHGGRQFRVDTQLDHATILAQDTVNGDWTHLLVAELRPPGSATPQEAPGPIPDLVANESEYAEAQRRFNIIQPLLTNPHRTRQDMEARAAATGTGRSTLYEWLSTYEDSPQLSSLIPRKRGRPKGRTTLEAKREAVITAAIASTHTTKQRKRVAEAVKEVQRLSRAADIVAPHANTIRARIAALPRAATLRARGQRDLARNTLTLIRGSIPGAEHPLSMVQVDHSKGDIDLVDDELRLPIGRPWITVAIDVRTRMVCGIVVSLEPPGAFAAGLCLAHAMLPKNDYLARLGVGGDWPVWGKPTVVHMDNAKEFRGHVLERAFAEYRIRLQLRPVATPHYGGHIERYMGTLSNETRNLPGATFSSPAERQEYDSSAHASMTLNEYERHVVDWIVNTYHKQGHSGLSGMTPHAKWVQCIAGADGQPGVGVKEPPSDPERLKLDFLPFERRTVQRYGIVLDDMTYSGDVLRLRVDERSPENARLKRKFIVRRDPRDITRIWFLDPDTSLYHALSTRNLSRPSVSLWEWKALKRGLQAEGAATIDEDALFTAQARRRAWVEEAQGKTKAARRERQRTANAARAAAGGTKAPSHAKGLVIDLDPEPNIPTDPRPAMRVIGQTPAAAHHQPDADALSEDDIEGFDVDPGLG